MGVDFDPLLGVTLTNSCRVKLPKTFLAINLSDLFSVEDHEKRDSDSEGLEMKTLHPKPKAAGNTDQAGDAPPEQLVAVGDLLTSSAKKEEEPVSPGTKVDAPAAEATTQETV